MTMATVSFIKGESPSGDKCRVILAPVGSEGELFAISTTVYSAKRQSKFTNENSKRKYIKCIQVHVQVEQSMIEEYKLLKIM